MKIVLVCKSDLNGGAAVVTYRLMNALRALGIDATMLVINKLSKDPNVRVVGTGHGRSRRFLWERACIYANNGLDRTNLFKVSIANTGYDLTRNPLIKEADAVILSWINQGMMSLNDIKRLVSTGKRVLWIMHDMWCMTGICHHALQCEHYTDQCGHCPYINNGAKYNDLSHLVWTKKKKLYDSARSMTMIAVSSWLAACAKNSGLLRLHDTRIIHNAFPDNLFYVEPRGIDIPPTIDTTKTLIVMGAARLDDPIKDFPTCIEALNRLAISRPDIASKCQAVFYGDLRNPSILERLSLPHTHIGRITDQAVMREIFSYATIVLSTSLFETLPGTIIEGMAAGCTPVSTGNGGQRDIIDDGTTGYITERNPDDIARTIARAIDTPFDRQSQHDVIAVRFGANTIARKILSVIGD